MKFRKAVPMTSNIIMLDYLATNVEKEDVEPFLLFGGFLCQSTMQPGW